MVMREFVSVPYPPIEKLGVIGDRRTAALVAADGTLCWMSLPNYDGFPIFGALLDSTRGGGWKLGPRARRFGRQRYTCGPILHTAWEERDFSVDLLDFMPWPQDNRSPQRDGGRTVIRRLRCLRGGAPCRIVLEPRRNFHYALKPNAEPPHGISFANKPPLFAWCSQPIGKGPIRCEDDRVEGEFTLGKDEEIWCAFGSDEEILQWSPTVAADALRATMDYWTSWISSIDYRGRRRSEIIRSAWLVHLLTFAPTGALVASPTTSLPERIGGERNYDYRYTWIRDASLALSLLAKLGLPEDAKRFVDFLAGLESSTGRPLQVLYTINGREAPAVEEIDIAGYRRSRPVRIGNAAVSMSEIDSYGYLTDCISSYLKHGGQWHPEYWTFIRHIADFTMSHWQQPGSSIWELRPARNFVASKIMSAVTLDRAAQIAKLTGHDGDCISAWVDSRNKIMAEVMSAGWSNHLGAFRQHYDADMVDASALLAPLMGLLPAHHPRVAATLDALVDQLAVNGFLHRFVGTQRINGKEETVGDEEGAFLICSFWLAHVLALAGHPATAEAIISKAESIAGELGLFAEAVDARDNTFLGNMPLVFSQVEYAKAAIALDRVLDCAVSPDAVPAGERA